MANEITLNELVGSILPITVECGSAKVDAEVYEMGLSADELNAMVEAGASDFDFLAKIYKSIAVKDGDKQIEVTPDNLRKLPSRFVKAMTDAVKSENLAEAKKKQ